jgi:hypothetical protein
METRHIKLEYTEALTAKKNMLAAELNLLQILKKIQNYKILRRKEQICKNKLKTSIKSLRAKSDLLVETLPPREQKKEVAKPELKAEKKKIEAPTKKEHKTKIQSELDDIKNQLAKLDEIE